MKIMFYAWGLGQGGAERVISVLANDFSKQHDVSIVINSTNNKAYNIHKNVNVYELDTGKTKNKLVLNILRIINTKKIFKKVMPDVIICFLPVPSFRALLCKRRLPSKIIVCERNNPQVEYAGFINKTLMKLLYKKADGFVFQTNEQKQYFNENIQKKSIVIKNPIKDEFLADVDFKNREEVIVNVARLHKQKNHKLLINAFKKISDKYKNYKLKIYGNGPLHDELVEYINSQGLSKRVELCGITDNVRNELIKSKVFVLSSDYEGMPNALIEAMASGVACIATDCPCGGSREIIQDNFNGFLVPCNDIDALASKLDSLLSNDSLIQKFGKNSLKVRNEFSLPIISKQWNNYLTGVVKNDK